MAEIETAKENAGLGVKDLTKLFALFEPNNTSFISFCFSFRPTELDALVFGHLHSVLTRYLPDDSLSSIVRAHKNLEDFVMRILREFFQ